MSARVKMCCHTSGSNPKYTIDVGDTILFRSITGEIKEATVTELSEQSVTCEKFNGEAHEIPITQIMATCIN